MPVETPALIKKLTNGVVVPANGLVCAWDLSTSNTVNLMPVNSHNFTTSWANYNASSTVTITAGQSDPDKGTGAYRFYGKNTGSTYIYNCSALTLPTVGVDIFFRIWIKNNSANVAKLVIDGGTYSPTIPANSPWTLYTISEKNFTYGSVVVRLNSNVANTQIDLMVYHPKLGVGDVNTMWSNPVGTALQTFPNLAVSLGSNLVKYSESMGNAVWALGASGMTRTITYGKDGKLNTAARIRFSGGITGTNYNSYIAQSLVAGTSVGDQYTFGAWIYSPSAQTVVVGANSISMDTHYDAVASAGGGRINLTQGWKFYKWRTIASTTSNAYSLQFAITTYPYGSGTNPFDLTIWHPQCNYGPDLKPYTWTTNNAGGLNTLIRGTAAGSDTNDPMLTADGLVFGSDDVATGPTLYLPERSVVMVADIQNDTEGHLVDFGSHQWYVVPPNIASVGKLLPELVGNPGFETSGTGGSDLFSSWIELGATGTRTRDTVNMHSGNSALKLTRTGATWYDPSVYQNIAITGAGTYHLKFEASGSVHFGLYNVSASAYIYGPTTIGTYSEYTTYNNFFTIPTGCTSVQLYLATGTSGSVLYDDVSFKQVAITGSNTLPCIRGKHIIGYTFNGTHETLMKDSVSGTPYAVTRPTYGTIKVGNYPSNVYPLLNGTAQMVLVYDRAISWQEFQNIRTSVKNTIMTNQDDAGGMKRLSNGLMIPSEGLTAAWDLCMPSKFNILPIGSNIGSPAANSFATYSSSTVTITTGRTGPSGATGAFRVTSTGGSSAIKAIHSDNKQFSRPCYTNAWIKNNAATPITFVSAAGSKVIPTGAVWTQCAFQNATAGLSYWDIYFQTASSGTNLDVDVYRPMAGYGLNPNIWTAPIGDYTVQKYPSLHGGTADLQRGSGAGSDSADPFISGLGAVFANGDYCLGPSGLLSSDGTFICILKTNANPYQDPMCYWGSAPSGAMLFFECTPSQCTAYVGKADNTYTTATYPMSSGAFHIICATRKNQVLTLYVDGYTATSTNVGSPFVTALTHTLQLGGRGGSACDTIAFAAVYNRAISSEAYNKFRTSAKEFMKTKGVTLP